MWDSALSHFSGELLSKISTIIIGEMFLPYNFSLGLNYKQKSKYIIYIDYCYLNIKIKIKRNTKFCPI